MKACLVAAALAASLPLAAHAAAVAAPRPAPSVPQPGPAPVQAPKSPRDAARIDLTGYWVSVVTEDWRFRMVTPPKGDYTSVPLNAAGKKLADAWDIASDGGDNACRPYGAAALLRMPGRLHITWADPQTLKLEADAGTQVRILRFGAPPTPVADRSWQGVSLASWENNQPQASGLAILNIPAPPPSFALKVVTTGLRAGYLRRNGVPYSENTVLTEYFDTLKYEDTEWLVVTTVVEDPANLQQPFITTTHFKREPDGAKWSPTPCRVVPPTRGPNPAYPE